MLFHFALPQFKARSATVQLAVVRKLPSGFHPGDAVRISIMRKKKYLTRPLKLILVLGALGGVAIGFYALPVESVADAPLGPRQLSWSDKPESERFAPVLGTGAAMQEQKQSSVPERPLIDQALPEETEFALFALG